MCARVAGVVMPPPSLGPPASLADGWSPTTAAPNHGCRCLACQQGRADWMPFGGLQPACAQLLSTTCRVPSMLSIFVIVDNLNIEKK